MNRGRVPDPVSSLCSPHRRAERDESEGCIGSNSNFIMCSFNSPRMAAAFERSFCLERPVQQGARLASRLRSTAITWIQDHVTVERLHRKRGIGIRKEKGTSLGPASGCCSPWLVTGRKERFNGNRNQQNHLIPNGTRQGGDWGGELRRVDTVPQVAAASG